MGLLKKLAGGTRAKLTPFAKKQLARRSNPGTLGDTIDKLQKRDKMLRSLTYSGRGSGKGKGY